MTEPLLLSISDIEQFVVCPQRFINSRIELRARAYFSRALAVGTIVHKVLEARYAGEDVDEAIEISHQKVLTEFDPSFDQMEGVDKEVALLLPHIRSFDLPERILATEQEFSFPFDDSGDVRLVGRWDAIIGAMGGIWHNQHKTLAPNIDVEKFSDYIQYSWHEAWYEEAAKVTWPEEKFMGTCLNVVSKISKARLAAGENPMRVFWLSRRPSIQAKLMSDIRSTVSDIIAVVGQYSLGQSVRQHRKACLVNGWECTFKGICDGKAKLTDFDKREPRYAVAAIGVEE